jgi:hypothetical protein
MRPDAVTATTHETRRTGGWGSVSGAGPTRAAAAPGPADSAIQQKISPAMAVLDSEIRICSGAPAELIVLPRLLRWPSIIPQAHDRCAVRRALTSEREKPAGRSGSGRDLLPEVGLPDESRVVVAGFVAFLRISFQRTRKRASRPPGTSAEARACGGRFRCRRSGLCPMAQLATPASANSSTTP